MTAIKKGQLDIVRYLIEKGANPNMEDPYTPLMCAADNGHIEIVRLLLSKGAKVDPTPVQAKYDAGYYGTLL